MKTTAKRPFTLGLLALTLVFKALAQTHVIEPDSCTNGMVLDHLLPQVHLTTAGSDNLPIPPVTFEVTASEDSFGFTSTGTNVFGHAGVQFWNSDRRLRMEFTAPVAFVTIDFIGGQYFYSETGQLDAYNSAGQLVASYVTAPRPDGSIETMTVSRAAGDIAVAIAYVPPDAGSFGRLDNLRFGALPVLNLDAVKSGANAGCMLNFTGLTNASYRVWASTNLQDWSVVGSASQAQPGVFSYHDAAATNHPRRFYRVSQP